MLCRLHVLEGFIVTGTVVGAAIGSALGGPISDKFGRKTTLKVADVLFLIGAALMALAQSSPMLIAGQP